MASETAQLTNDFEEIKTTLEQHPNIKVVQTEGDPPDYYEVEYQLKGFVRNSDGSVQQASQHLMRISLPFGYPHFPPAVKPLTPIFHPDIDPDAVRIASYWQQTPSLAQLIIHIGEMIRGEAYNLDEPFNQEAADWYAEHPDDFPLDNIQVAELDTSDFSLEMEEEDDFDLSMDLDEPLNIEMSEEEIQAKTLEIQSHLDKGQTVSADRLLAEIPNASHIAEVEAVQQVISSRLNERDQLIQELELLENEDKFTEALELFEKIKKIAIDTPALSDIGHRLQQSQTMLDAFASDAGKPETEKIDKTDKEKPAKVVTKKKKKPAVQASSDKERTTVRSKITRKAQTNIPVKPLLAAGALLVIITGLVLLYTRDVNILMTAERDFIEARGFVRQQQFDKAEAKGMAALTAVKTVLTPGIGKDDLLASISAMLNSTDFQKQTAGEEKYKGEWLPSEKIGIFKELEVLTGEAEALKMQGRYEQAISAYEKAHVFAVQNSLDERIETLVEKITQLSSEENKEKNFKKQEEAEKIYRVASEFFQKIEDEKKNVALDQSKKSATGAQWQQAVEFLEDADRKLKTMPEVYSSEKQREIERMLAYSHLYQKLALARQAYESGNLKTAITEYQKTLHLLDEEKSIFAAIHKEAVSKIHRAILMLKISLELKAGIEAEDKNDLRTSLSRYKAIAKMISSNRSNKDKDLIAIKKYVQTKIKEQSLKRAKSSNQEWLKKNFENIFRKAYPSTRSSILSHPKITFIKIMNGRLFYKISCSERKRGSSYRLELNYQYNLSSNQWTPYLGKL